MKIDKLIGNAHDPYSEMYFLIKDKITRQPMGFEVVLDFDVFDGLYYCPYGNSKKIQKVKSIKDILLIYFGHRIRLISKFPIYEDEEVEAQFLFNNDISLSLRGSLKKLKFSTKDRQHLSKKLKLENSVRVFLKIISFGKLRQAEEEKFLINDGEKLFQRILANVPEDKKEITLNFAQDNVEKLTCFVSVGYDKDKAEAISGHLKNIEIMMDAAEKNQIILLGNK